MSASLSRLQQFYSELKTPLLLRAIIKEEFSGNIAVLTSFDAYSGILLSLIATINPAIPVLFLNTGKHFPETLEYARILEKNLALSNIRWLSPDPNLLRSDEKGELWQSEPARCCFMRKTEPLNRMIESMGLLALITDRRRHQLPERQNLERIELDENGVFLINPLADWEHNDAREEAFTAHLPPHPLKDKGFDFIGCASCSGAGSWAKTIGIENEQKLTTSSVLPAALSDWSV